jgi:uncharacterized membrane protein
MTPRVLAIGVVGVVLLATGLVAVAGSWWALSVVLVVVTGLAMLGVATPVVRATRALQTLYRLADAAVWRGGAVSPEDIAEVIEEFSSADGEQRRADWARYRAFLAADQEESP